MDVSRYSAPDFTGARSRFLDAAAAAGADMETLLHPLRGPAGERLFCDTAWIGPADAKKVFVTISGTHGVEGYCGSMCQSAWLSQGFAKQATDAGLAHLAIHAINPHGFAWVRRVTEDNVDLNRNFIDFSQPLPVNEGYRDLHAAVLPEDWNAASQAASEAFFERYQAEKGDFAYRVGISGGQFEFPDGLFFGGHGPTWSHRRLRSIFEQRLANAAEIGVVDYHSGLGPYGYGEIIGGTPSAFPGHPLLERWYGDEATSSEKGTTRSAALHGKNSEGMRRFAPQARVAHVTLEYGTEPSPRVRHALRADNWLHVHGDLASEQAKAIKAEIRHCFGPDDPVWREAVWTRAIDVCGRMIAGLAAL